MIRLGQTESAYPASGLAQASDADLLTLALWCTVLLAALATLVWGILRAKRTLLSEESSPGWTLQDLRDMRDRGDLTASQFVQLRASILGIGTPGGDGQPAKSARGESGVPPNDK